MWRPTDLARAIVNSIRHGRFERDLRDELASHLDSRVADLERRGLSAPDARRQARIEFGSLDRYAEGVRDVRRARGLEDLLRDLRYAWRGLRRSPGLLFVGVLSLGLGIGVNTTLFAAIHAIFLQVPTAAAPDRLVRIEPGNGNQFSYLNYRDLRDRLVGAVFAELVGSRSVSMTLRSGDEIENISALAVTANFFEGLGIRARMGRVFTAVEAAPSRDARLAVLSHTFWRRRFQADPSIVGRTLTLGGQPFVAIGILAERHRPVTGVSDPDVYVPIAASTLPTLHARPNANGLAVIGRLSGGVGPEQAQAAVTAAGQRLEREYPRDNEGFGRPARVVPLRGLSLTGAPQEIYLFPLLLSVLFGLLLLIACANVAGLLLARAAHRRREIAVRFALGASRLRVVQSLLAESLLLALLGAAAGLLLTLWLTTLLRGGALRMGSSPLYLHVRPDVTWYAYGLLLALITGVACGLVPALRATRTRVLDEIQQGGSHTATARLRLRHAFVVGQVALSLTLLVVCALFVRSLIRIATLQPGFDRDRGIVATIARDAARDAADPHARQLFAEQLVERLHALPGVQSASLANVVPLGGDSNGTRFRAERNPGVTSPRTDYNSVGPRYFETLGIPIVCGRAFDTPDRSGAPPVVIVNQTFAASLFRDVDPIGQRVAFANEPFAEIVGIAQDSSVVLIGEKPRPVVYFPYAQRPGRLIVHVRVANPSAAVQRSVKQAIADLDPTVAVDVQTLRDATRFEVTLRRTLSLLLGALGLLGLLLAMIGLYGVLAYVVASRTPEIGLRLALGAAPHQVLRDTIARGLRLVALGILIGSVLAFAITRPLGAFLGGLSPSDPIAFGVTIAFLLLIGAVASYLPARRATRVDPTVALRHQ